MFLIVGLGNPGVEYAATRHNIGFDMITYLSDKYNIPVNSREGKALVGKGILAGEKVMLAQPQTYMNLSGESIIQFVNYYKIDIENVIIIYDDIDIEPGIVKLRKKGGAGSHNGMKSVLEHLKSGNFVHIRVGTGKPEFKELIIQYVIGKLNTKEYEMLSPAIKKAAESVSEILNNGIDIAMNKFNC